MRETRHQNGRYGSALVFEDGSGLAEITHRNSQLMDHRGREYMRIVYAQRLGLKSVVNTKRWKIRDSAKKIKRIIGRIAIELVFNECFIGRCNPPVETKSNSIGAGLKL